MEEDGLELFIPLPLLLSPRISAMSHHARILPCWVSSPGPLCMLSKHPAMALSFFLGWEDHLPYRVQLNTCLNPKIKIARLAHLIVLTTHFKHNWEFPNYHSSAVTHNQMWNQSPVLLQTPNTPSLLLTMALPGRTDLESIAWTQLKVQIVHWGMVVPAAADPFPPLDIGSIWRHFWLPPCREGTVLAPDA